MTQRRSPELSVPKVNTSTQRRRGHVAVVSVVMGLPAMLVVSFIKHRATGYSPDTPFAFPFRRRERQGCSECRRPRDLSLTGRLARWPLSHHRNSRISFSEREFREVSMRERVNAPSNRHPENMPSAAFFVLDSRTMYLLTGQACRSNEKDSLC